MTTIGLEVSCPGLSFKQDEFDLFPSQHDAGSDRCMFVRTTAVNPRPRARGHKTSHEGGEHPGAVAHVVVEIVPGERKHILAEKSDGVMGRAEDEELGSEGDGLELDDRGLSNSLSTSMTRERLIEMNLLREHLCGFP